MRDEVEKKKNLEVAGVRLKVVLAVMEIFGCRGPEWNVWMMGLIGSE